MLTDLELSGAYNANRHLFPSQAAVLENCDYLVDLHVWPPQKIRPRAWLGNFNEAELPFALFLLSKFVYFSDELTDQLFESAFHSIAGEIVTKGSRFHQARAEWNQFCLTAMVSVVQGERPNLADSGNLFARKARQVLGLAEHHLLQPIDALRRIVGGGGASVVFVDDFAGSGNQFLHTWRRKLPVAPNLSLSFQDVAAQGSLPPIYYCNAITTEAALDRINSECPAVQVICANVIPRLNSLVAADSAMWPRDIRDAGLGFIRRASQRAGYSAGDGGQSDWGGFHHLGLALAFEHSTPDATLPLFFSERGDWKWLVRRQ